MSYLYAKHLNAKEPTGIHQVNWGCLLLSRHAPFLTLKHQWKSVPFGTRVHFWDYLFATHPFRVCDPLENLCFDQTITASTISIRPAFLQDWPPRSLTTRMGTSRKTYWTSWWKPNRKFLHGSRAWLMSTSIRAATADALRGPQTHTVFPWIDYDLVQTCMQCKKNKKTNPFMLWSTCPCLDCFWRFAGGFGARDYRQTAAVGNAGGFGARGIRNQVGHGGARGFAAGAAVILVAVLVLARVR